MGKYKWSFYLLLGFIVMDAFLHRGMLRVWLPSRFGVEVVTAALPQCAAPLLYKGGRWKKGVNTIEAIPDPVQDYRGLELDIYFDTAKADFVVFHDSAESNRLPITKILDRLREKNFSGSLWLDFKNLASGNAEVALRRLVELAGNYQLYSRIIVESGKPEFLQSFCSAGFFTSYYVPYFNPYLLKETERTAFAETIAKECRRYPVNALSGYYFQYPFLKASFPGMPLLTWVDDPKWSVVNFLFQQKLRSDPSLMVIIEN